MQVAPRTEKVVADTWKEVLGVDSVAVHDNFFDIGGHSLLAVRVVTRLDRKLVSRTSGSRHNLLAVVDRDRA